MRSSFYQFSVCVGLAAILIAGNSGAVLAQKTALEKTTELLTPSNSNAVKAGLTQALEIGKLGNHKFSDPKSMQAFYGARAHEVAWMDGSFFNQPKGRDVLTVLDQAWEHGLNPKDYHVEEIRRLMDEAKGDQRFEVDLMISDALVRYGHDLSGMRVNPKTIGQNAKYWRQPLNGNDVLSHVSKASDVKRAMAGMAPQGKLYKALQDDLRRIYLNPQAAETQPIRVEKLIRPGSRHSAVLEIRERMGFSAEQGGQGSTYYDDQLAQAVMAFQKSHGATPDGIIGQHTVKLLNMTQTDRLNQILANLERLRWVEPNKPSRYIMVNVPAAMLWAVEDNNVKIEMPVVVGREKRPTNIFTTEVTGIRFNPTWTVPPTIKKEDYLPKLREDPYYLSDRGIELMGNNMTLDPGQVDWAAMTWKDVNAMRMVQGSGRNNPLGLVRFIMNNPFNIYLHDTPQKSYFARTNRALSSGCVRLQDAQKLADFVLEPNKGWSNAKRKQVIDTGRMTEIRAESPLPVYILYQTVWLGDRGQIVYGQDIYGHDQKLLKALSDIGGIVLPKDKIVTKTAQNSVVNRGNY